MLSDPPARTALTSISPEATTALAERLASVTQRGDVYLLEGPVGAGKSHFARSFIQACLPYPEDIPSPTFTLVQTYEAPDWPIWHCDLYRMSDSSELIELGLIDAMDGSVCLIEWPDRLDPAMRQGACLLSFEVSGDSARAITLTGGSARHHAAIPA
ncbi:MAG: tRNA (adenosine(37)-N6)-threonylcarbamoyltransferase complex ATPase subunit type 1 TsaE [Pseudomonadota bacterium]